MIKDSKLIGTKIAAPFGWKQFKAGALFKLNRGSRLIVANREHGVYPFVTAGFENRGVSDYINNPEQCLFAGNVITIDMFGNVFYRSNSFKADDNVLVLTLLFTDDMDSLIYLETILQKAISSRFNYGHQFRQKNFYELNIVLPITPNNKPDFEWMSAYIKAVKADYLAQKELANQREIKDYLTAGKVDSMDVTDADRQFVRDFEKLPRRKFKVGDLFDFKSSMSLNKSDLKFVSKQDSFAIPYITRTVLNNGINGYVDSRLVGDEYINDGGEFAFGLLGLTAFYQCNRYCTGQFVKRFVPKFELNELLAMFFKTLLDKQIELFKTVSISSYTDLINDVLDIELPVIANDEVDVHSIEKYMQIQSKPLINKVSEALAPVGGGGGIVIDSPSIERYMQIQVKLMITKRKSYLDHELELIKQV